MALPRPSPSFTVPLRRHMSQVQAGTFAPRIFTLGIGPHCNTYFLKQLSIVGRGYTLTSLMADNVYDKMVRRLWPLTPAPDPCARVPKPRVIR